MWVRTSRLRISARPWGVNLMRLPNRCTRSIISLLMHRPITLVVPRCFGGTSSSGPSYRWIRMLVSHRLPREGSHHAGFILSEYLLRCSTVFSQLHGVLPKGGIALGENDNMTRDLRLCMMQLRPA